MEAQAGWSERVSRVPGSLLGRGGRHRLLARKYQKGSAWTPGHSTPQSRDAWENLDRQHSQGLPGVFVVNRTHCDDAISGERTMAAQDRPLNVVFDERP